jgi:hypothetical protein
LSFLFEPIAVGLAIAFSAAAPWIALMATAAFFARQPLKTAYIARNNHAIWGVSIKLAIVFGVAAFISAVGAGMNAGAWVFYPFAVAAPLAIQQIFLDLSTRGRSPIAEITGAAAISSTVAAIALAGGLGWPAATALWAVFVCRFIPSILYVRERLRLEKGKPFELVGAIGSHLISIAVVAGMAVFGFASWLTVAVLGFLAARCVYGLSGYRVKMKAMQIGVWEVIYGVLTVISIVFGYYLGI